MNKIPYLLAGRNGQPLKADRVRRVFHRAVEAIGLKQPKRTMGNMTFGSPVPHSLAAFVCHQHLEPDQSPGHLSPAGAAGAGRLHGPPQISIHRRLPEG